MDQGMELLDQALELGKRERLALEEGEYEAAIEISRKRAELTGMAWNCMDRQDQEPFRARLMQLSTLQKQLTLLATTAHNAIKRKMNSSKQEKRRMNAYQVAVGHGLQ